MFYGHFPDALLAEGLAVQRIRLQKKEKFATSGLLYVLKRLYRGLLDWVEGITTRTGTSLSLSLHLPRTVTPEQLVR